MRYDYKKIGLRIKEKRKELHKTQNEIAEKIGIGRNQYINLEKGIGENVPISALTKLCEIFNCSIGYLLCEYDMRLQDRKDIADVMGWSEHAIERMYSEANSRTFINNFFEYSDHYTISQTVLNYAYKARIENDSAKQFRSSIDGHDKKALLYGERAWALDAFTKYLNTIYNPETENGTFREYVEKFEKEKQFNESHQE